MKSIFKWTQKKEIEIISKLESILRLLHVDQPNHVNLMINLIDVYCETLQSDVQ